MKTIRAFERSLDQRFRKKGSTSDGDFTWMYRLRARIRNMDADLDGGCVRSANAWAGYIGTCAWALNCFSSAAERRGMEGVLQTQRFLEISPARLIRMMAECLKRTMEIARAHKRQGIDTQANVTVLPFFDRGKSALKRWHLAQDAMTHAGTPNPERSETLRAS